MYGVLVLLGLILLSSLPVIIVYFWFRTAKYEFSIYWFLFILLVGAAAVFPALIFQGLLNFSFHHERAAVFYKYFVRIAFTEEFSRLLMLIIFFRIYSRISPEKQIIPVPESERFGGSSYLSFNQIKKATAAGLIAGLGFSLIENAVYAASDPDKLALRIIITAAVHGACGARIGAAAVLLRRAPIQGILRIFTATAIHGVYNLLVDMSGFSPTVAILIAISALFSSILTISGGWSDSAAAVNAAADIVTEPTAIDKKEDNS